METETVVRTKCPGCGKTVDGDLLGCSGCYGAPLGDRWPHDTCGEAGSYCDNDCHGHEHDTLRDGSVLCYPICEQVGCDEPFRGDGDFCPKHTEVCLECGERDCTCKKLEVPNDG